MLLAGFLGFVPLGALAQQRLDAGARSDTLEVRFKLDDISVDQGFDGNRRRIRAFRDACQSQYAGKPQNTLQLDIYAGASPEGTASHNRWLGRQRGLSIRNFLRDSLGLQVGMINIHNLGPRWTDLYNSVARSHEPWRQEVLDIIGMEPSADENSWDHREYKLRALREGTVWPELLEKYLAPLRSGGSAIVSYHPERDTLYIAYGVAARDTVVVRDTTVIIHDYVPKKKERVPADQTPVWALKTNLLLLGVIAPNVEVEFPLGSNNRWSVEAELICPWWTFGRNAYAEQVLNVGVEFKYWLGKRKYHPCLDGWHIGLAAAFGYYDLEWKSEGYQGEHVNGYLNIGYQHRWGKRKRWGIDASLGLGVLYTPLQRHYLGSSVFPETHLEPYDDHLMYQNKATLLWPGASHINVSLMYFFDLKRRKE